MYSITEAVHGFHSHCCMVRTLVEEQTGNISLRLFRICMIDCLSIMEIQKNH